MDHASPPIRSPAEANGGCTLGARLGAFHDGELNAVEARQMAQHLTDCAECRAELEDLCELSSLAGAIGGEGMSRAAVRRVHQSLDSEPRLTLLRIAGVLTGVAASAMVIGGAWLWDAPPQVAAAHRIVILPEQGPSWQTYATNLEAPPLPRAGWEVRDQRMLADARLANWMIEGLSGREP